MPALPGFAPVQLSPSIRLRAGGIGSLVGEIAPAGALPSRRAWPARLAMFAGACAFATMIAAHGGQFVRALNRALHADWRLVLIATVLEAASVAGYVLLLHRIVTRANAELRLVDSYDMTLAGAAATRLLPTAGLGGAAVTVWALRARGMRAAEIAERLIAFLLVLYAVYISALLVSGTAVALGLVHVSAGHGLGLLGAGIAVGVLATVAVVFTAPTPVACVLDRAAGRTGRFASASRFAQARLPALRASAQRVRGELRRPHPALLGAVAWWAFDIAVLATMLRAFGVGLPVAALVLAYFLGTLFNVLPLPGSLSGGLVASLVALGAAAGPAIAAVLAYRTLAVWLPALPGVASLARLRRAVEAQGPQYG